MDEIHEALSWVLCPRFPRGAEGIDLPREARLPRVHPAGFCVFRAELPAALEAVAALREARSGAGGAALPWLCADLERGAGQHVPGLTRLPPALALGAAADADLARQAGALTAREALAAGIAVILAPVADVASEPTNPITATRAFGDDPREVARLAAAFAAGVREAGALPVVKHFPGHGDTREDSHLGLATVRASRETLEAREELPFRAAIDGGIPAVMVGHLVVPALTGHDGAPASLAPAVTARLRQALGFHGAILTDALDMGAIRAAGPGASQDDADFASEPAVRALCAGADVALLPHDPARAARAILQAVAGGLLPRARLLDAAARVRRLVGLARPAVRPSIAPDPEGAALAARIARASLVLEDGPLPPGLEALRRLRVTSVDDGGGERLPALVGALARRGVTADVEDAGGAGAARGVPRVIVVWSDVRAWKGRVVLDAPRRGAIERGLAAARSAGDPAVLVSIGCPQALLEVAERAPTLYAFDHDDASLDAVADVLTGRLEARGRRCFRGRGAATQEEP